MKNGIISPIFAGILFIFCSCATAETRENTYIRLTDGSKYTLLSPENIEKPMDNRQIISASYGDADYQIIAWVRADKTGIDMTLLNELGANMGELSWRGREVSFSSQVFPKSLRPEYIVADFQLCFYNAASLRQALEKNALSFEETENDRRVLDGNNTVIEITKNKNAVKFVNHLRGYAYTLEGDFP